MSRKSAPAAQARQAQAQKQAPAPSPTEPQRFDLGRLLGYHLQRLAGSLAGLAQQEVESLAGVSLPEYRILAILHSTGPCGVVALQQALFIDKAWISRTVTKLQERGLVSPSSDPADARRTVLRLTTRGERAAALLTERSLQRQARVLRDLTPAEIEQFYQLVGRIQRGVDQARQEAGDRDAD